MEDDAVWIAASALWRAVERRGDHAFDVGERLRPWLAAGTLRSRVTAIACNELGIDVEIDHDVPAEIWKRLQLGGLQIAADRMFILREEWPGPFTLFEAVGLLFERGGLVAALALDKFALAALDDDRTSDLLTSGHIAAPSVEAEQVPTLQKVGGGKPVDKAGWERFAAALAVVVAENDLETDVSAASIYKKVADYLARRGHKCFEIDNVRSTITRAQAWKQGVLLDGDQM